MNGITRIFDLLLTINERYQPFEPVLYGKSDGRVYFVDRDQYRNSSFALAISLLDMGLKPGDHIGVILNNRPEWNFVDMAVMLIGCVQVPVYSNLSEDQFQFIFNDAEIKALIINDVNVWNKQKIIIKSVPSLRKIISVDPVEGLPNIGDLIQKSTGVHDTEAMLKRIHDSIMPDQLAAIIYTSGTTGRPKGVMLSHGNLVSNFTALTEILAQQPAKKAVSMLPLCHIYERVLNYVYQNSGTAIWYLTSMDNLKEDLLEANPEIFCAVPRLIEKLYDAIIAKGRDLKGIKRYIFFRSLFIGQMFEPGRSHSFIYHLQLEIARRLVFEKWHEALGKNLITIVSGGATLNPKITHIFWAAGFKIMEGYGLTETSPVVAVSNFLKDGVRIGTVGPILNGVEVAFANDGEILVRGPNVMQGYYKRPERTAEVLDSAGWFHTGDIGQLIENKYLKITDRKKEIFKTSGGKYIAPQVIESTFKESAFIEHMMVIGENRKHPSALIVPSMSYLRSWCTVKEIPFSSDEDIMKHSRVRQRIEREIFELNQKFARHEQIKKWELITDNWSVESGELSPTLKLRRKFLLEKYGELIEAMYNRP